MGCNSSTATKVIESNGKPMNGNRKRRPGTPGPKSIAFEVKLDDDDSRSTNSSSFKSSKLPKRLQRLEEEQQHTITAEEIAERQRLAEKRRKSAIEERVLKSKYFIDKVFAANRPENTGNKKAKKGSNKNNKSFIPTPKATIKVDKKKKK